MRVLVTGATGFVGGHLMEHLVSAGDHVVGLSRRGVWPASHLHLASQARLEPCDLAVIQESRLAQWLHDRQPEAIYHLAAQPNPQQSLAHPRETWDQNLGAALNLLEAARKANLKTKILLVGSGVSYGNPAPEYQPVDESCPLLPNNPYAASKAAVDLLGIQHHLAHGTEVLMVRPFNHAGPRQSDRYVLASLARQVAAVEAGRALAVEHGNLAIVRDFTDVRDIVQAYRLLVLKGRPGQIYNLGTGRDVSLQQMLNILIGQARVPIPTHADPARMRTIDQPRLLANAGKLRQDTDWTPQIPIETTLGDMLQYWREQTALSD